MNHPLLKYLCCPHCKKLLIHTGKGLSCNKCKTVYAISNGIPVLIDISSLPPHLQGQVKYFEKEDLSRGSYVLEAWQIRYVDNFLKHIVWKNNSLIIDNATGSGYMAIELAKKGYNVIAIDLTFAELVKLRQTVKKLKLQKKILLVCASSEELPIKSNVAHGMAANAILEHLPNEKKAVQEIARVLKKHASLMVAVPILLRYVWPFLWPVNIRHDRRIGHLRRYTKKSLLTVFKQFQYIYVYYTGHLIKVICLLLYIQTKNVQWNVFGEKLDRFFQTFSYGSNNIVMILKKI